MSGFEGGFFLQPTVLNGVRNDMKVAQEEIFGPVLSVIPWENEDELLALANGVGYGLASGIWSTARRPRASMVSATASRPGWLA